MIGIFSLAYVPFVGGAEVAIKEITDRLSDYRFSCFTYRFKPEWQKREVLGNVDVIRIGDGKGYYGQSWLKFFYIFQAWRVAEVEHKKEPIRIIWAIMASYGGLAALLFKLWHPSIPMLLTLQEGDSESHILRRVGIFYPFWRLIFKKADYVQCISNYLADFAKRHGATCPVEVVPNGVDITRIMNHELGIRNESKNEKIIITTSRLVHKNGIDVLIRAAVELKSIIPNSLFIIQILGSGPDEQKLKNLAAELGIADKVEFLGHIEPEKIPEYLAQADIFVRPSRSEGLGNSFLEAMAAGLPIIGTPVGGIPDFLRNYNPNDPNKNPNDPNGLFAPVDDHIGLAQKIKLLIENFHLRKRLGENGRKLVAEKYNWDIIAISFKRIFEGFQK